jgi:uncharacterized protein YgbK (DUF1537 family)
VREVLAAAPVDVVVAVGGDTAGAIVAAMRWAPLAVAGAIGPGIAVVDLAADRPARRRTPAPRWLITKSGGFGDPSTLRRLVRRLTKPSAARSAAPPR